MLVPYYKIPLRDSNGDFLVSDVVVGPTPYLEQSIRSTKSYLVSKGLGSVDVRPTDVPLRAI